MMNGGHALGRNQAARMELLSDGVLLVWLSGPLTGQQLLRVKADLVANYSGQTIRAFVADYTSAAVAMDGAALDAVLSDEAPGAVPTMPAAMVVSPICMDLFRGHCARMALLGHFRRAFTQHAPALAWARRMAQRPTMV